MLGVLAWLAQHDCFCKVSVTSAKLQFEVHHDQCSLWHLIRCNNMLSSPRPPRNEWMGILFKKSATDWSIRLGACLNVLSSPKSSAGTCSKLGILSETIFRKSRRLMLYGLPF